MFQILDPDLSFGQASSLLLDLVEFTQTFQIGSEEINPYIYGHLFSTNMPTQLNGGKNSLFN